MAKRKKPMTSELPTMNPATENVYKSRQNDDEVITSFTESAPIVPSFEDVTTTIPFIDGKPQSAGHQDEAHRIDMGSLTKERMRKVKAMRRGYIAADIRMEGGYEVKTNRDALFCFLDHLDI